MQMDSIVPELAICPVCNGQTDSLKQYRVIRSLVALPWAVVFTSVVHRSCPSCMRALVWKRCLINGLTTWIVGYIILVPYTVALSFATFRKGHSWTVLQDITPQMQLDKTWVNDATSGDKAIALLALVLCFVPGIGVLYCWWAHWKTYRKSGWVHKTAELAAIVSYFSSIVALGIYLES
jgi:hypothetical protein